MHADLRTEGARMVDHNARTATRFNRHRAYGSIHLITRSHWGDRTIQKRPDPFVLETSRTLTNPKLVRPKVKRSTTI